jgi:hypothetical protein
MPEDVSGIVLLVVLGLLVATVYGPWQWYCIDQARQELFEIRARIFNVAADGKIAGRCRPTSTWGQARSA